MMGGKVGRREVLGPVHSDTAGQLRQRRAGAGVGGLGDMEENEAAIVIDQHLDRTSFQVALCVEAGLPERDSKGGWSE